MGLIKKLPNLYFEGGDWRINADYQPLGHGWRWSECQGKRATIYVVEGNGLHKIGLTTNFKTRFSSLVSGSPHTIKRVATRSVPLVSLTYAEAWLHNKFADRRVRGEWFDVPEGEIRRALAAAVRRAEVFAEFTALWWRDVDAVTLDREPPSVPASRGMGV